MTTRMTGCVTRPANCQTDLTESKRCPHCKQFHLRPGYCQALDPINAEKYPHLHPDLVNKSPVHGERVNNTVNSNEARREYRREWMRKKRAGLP
jgi:hypothetical protein